MEIKYELEVKISVEIDGEKVDDVYTESGSGPCDDVPVAVDMFVRPRVAAAGYVMIKKIKKDILKKLKEGKE